MVRPEMKSYFMDNVMLETAEYHPYLIAKIS